MPSKSWKQARMMAKAAADEEYASKRGVPQHVAQDFNREDLEAGIFFDPRGNLIAEAEGPQAEAQAVIYNREFHERLAAQNAEDEARGMTGQGG